MAALDQILKYLDKPEVTEVILQSGKAITARSNGHLRPLSAAPLAQSALEMLLTHTELTVLKGTGQPERLRVNGKNYQITVTVRGGSTMVRIELAERPTPTDSPAVQATTPAPAPLEPTPVPTLGRQGKPAPVERTSPPPVRTPTERPIPAAYMQAERSTLTTAYTQQVERTRTPTPIKQTPTPTPSPTRRTPPPIERTPTPAPAIQEEWSALPTAYTRPVERTPTPRPIIQEERSSPPEPLSGAEVSAPLVAPQRATAMDEPPPPQPWGPSQHQLRFDPMLLQLFQAARQKNASDVHIVANQPVRFRCVGDLLPQGDPLDNNTIGRLLLPLLAPHNIDQLERLGYADLSFETPNAGRIRANINRQKTGLKGCFRLIVDRPPQLKDLGLPEELAKVTIYHQGLAVVSGPNGHGKTTTMSALVNLINHNKADHIITVEDPIEIIHPVAKAVISQRQVGTHTNSFQSALKGALREDPDVIVIGELRDAETVEMALSAAETGHLVIATMSTPSGAKTIDRLIDMFPPEEQGQVRATLAGALKIVVSQRLIPSADGTHLVAAAELITGNVPLWNLIRDDKLYQLPSLLQRGRAFGMIRMDDSLKQLVQAGEISMENALRVASDPRILVDDPNVVAAGFRPRVAPEPNLDDDGNPKPKRGLFGR